MRLAPFVCMLSKGAAIGPQAVCANEAHSSISQHQDGFIVGPAVLARLPRGLIRAAESLHMLRSSEDCISKWMMQRCASCPLCGK